MRRGYYPRLLESEEGAYALLLGSDFVAAHNKGISGIRDSFGVRGVGFLRKGIAARVARRIPERHELKLWEFECNDENWQAMIYSPSEESLESIDYLLQEVAQSDKSDLLITAWNEECFVVFARTKKCREFVLDLYTAFEKKDVAIMLAKGTALAPRVLSLMIASKTPKAIKDQILESDKREAEAFWRRPDLENFLLRLAARYFECRIIAFLIPSTYL